MVRVTKCCCCFNLRYGYYTFGIICLLFRICAIFTLNFMPHALSATAVSVRQAQLLQVALPGIGYLVGWFVATSIILFIALKGIAEHKSILIYPFIVVLIVELIIMFFSTIFLTIAVSLWYLLDIFIIGAIDIYALICLISLHSEVKEIEGHASKSFEGHVPLRTV